MKKAQYSSSFYHLPFKPLPPLGEGSKVFYKACSTRWRRRENPALSYILRLMSLNSDGLSVKTVL